MKRVRLLPIVIFATLALLLFKGVGLLTNGGYVLVGAQPAQAAGGEGHGGGEGSGDAALSDGTIVVPSEPTLEDASPTLVDTAPELATLDKKAGGGHGATPSPESGGHGENPAPATEVAAAVPPTSTPAASPDAAAVTTPACPPSGPVVSVPPSAEAQPQAAADCLPSADAVPMQEDGSGHMVPLTGENGESLTEATILQRLSERRSELDLLASELDTRQALVDAAEKRLAERQALLQQLEDQINAMVDEKKTLEDEQFKSLVSMYEQMKPADAATILNALDMRVLVRVTKTMNPRKMSAIMAKMDPAVAQTLTMQIALADPEPTAQISGNAVSDLPQIVGQ